MEKISKYLAAALACIICLGLSACGKDFDAAGYTKSVLDARYHGVYEEYAEFRHISSEQAEEEIKDSRFDTARKQIEQVGDADDEAVASYIESLKEIEKLAKYEVKKAKKQEDGSYVITLSIAPVNAYEMLEKRSEEVAQEMVDEGKDPMKDGNSFVELLVESIHRSVSDTSYTEAETIEIKVTKNSDHEYAIETGGMEKLDEALFPKG